MSKQKIVIIGAGNVAWHLGHRLQEAGHEILQVVNRSQLPGQELADELDCEFVNKTDQINAFADIYLLAVSDHGIDDIILELRLPGKVVAHTSGAVPLRGMEHISENCGVFYPLQTLTKGNPVSFQDVPMLIEAANEPTEKKLTDLAKTISKHVRTMDSQKRRALHVAAVFVNNFANFLYTIAHDITRREDLEFSLLQPLMQETLNKLKSNSPASVQTGPARRSDFKTIEQHLNYLSKNEAYREVYLVLTESIMTAYKDLPETGDEPHTDGELWDFGDRFDEDGHEH